LRASGEVTAGGEAMTLTKALGIAQGSNAIAETGATGRRPARFRAGENF